MSGHDADVTNAKVSPTRVPQEERTRAMRQRLLEATVDCLVENGWSGTSTTLVSQRAGVSRGAQLHHFPTKNDLVVAAVEHLSELRGEELRQAAGRLPTGKRRTRAVLEMFADHFTSPVFTAALELWVAARTDETLHRAVVPLEQRVGRSMPWVSTRAGRGCASWCRGHSTSCAGSDSRTRSPTTPLGDTASWPPGRTPSTQS